MSSRHYPGALKKSVTIRLDSETIDYFKALSKSTGIPYQSLINLYLHDCAATGRKLSMRWVLPGEVREAGRMYRPGRRRVQRKSRAR